MKYFVALATCLVASFIFSQNEKIDNLNVQLAYQAQDSTKVDTSLMLISELYNTEAYKKAILFINQTAQLSKLLNYTKGLAETKYFKGLIYCQRNDYYNAIDNYTKSRAHYLKINDTLGIAKVSNSIGLLEIKRGNYAVGLQNSFSAIDIFEKRNLKNELSTAYNNLAETYYKTNLIDKALNFNFKALEIRRQLKDSHGLKASTKNIAELYSFQKEHRKAIEYYEKVLALLNPKTDQDLRGEILPKLGSEYLRFNEYDNAANYLIEGLKYNRKQGNDEGILKALNGIGNLNLQKRKLRLAELQLNEANAIAQKIDNKPELLENYKLHIALDSTRGYYKNAFFWQNKYYDLKAVLSKKDQPLFHEVAEPLNLMEPYNNLADVIVTQADIPITKKTWFNNPLVLYSAAASMLLLLTLLLFNYFKSRKYREIITDLKNKNAQEQERNKTILVF